MLAEKITEEVKCVLLGFCLSLISFTFASNQLFFMIKIDRFVFNGFQANTYILSNGPGDCIVVDCACQSPKEWETLQDFFTRNNLRPTESLHTHFHVDHMIGYPYLREHYGLEYKVHPASRLFIDLAPEFASVFGIRLGEVFQPGSFLADGDIIRLGDATIKVLYTPGHADGSVCFYAEADGFIISGDVLFRDSIGRTDLPTGNYDRLKDSITRILFTLPGETVVYPGHGPATTIEHEKNHNPFL